MKFSRAALPCSKSLLLLPRFPRSRRSRGFGS
jgi:hypothetical protein